MSIFGKIMSSIFGDASAQPPQAAPPPVGKTSTSAGAGSPPAAAASTSASGSPKSAAGPAVEPHVDVGAVLTKLASQNKEKLDWRSSDRRSDEAAQSRQQPFSAQGTGKRTELHRRYERLRQDECLAAQAGDDQAG